MALTARQRNKLPKSAFLDPTNRRFPIPTKAQARNAGISEAQRVRTLRNALARAAQPQARGVKKVTPTMAAAKVKTRSTASQIQTISAGGKRKPNSSSSRRRRR